jgi:hypothetical protein
MIGIFKPCKWTLHDLDPIAPHRVIIITIYNTYTRALSTSSRKLPNVFDIQSPSQVIIVSQIIQFRRYLSLRVGISRICMQIHLSIYTIQNTTTGIAMYIPMK